MTFRGRCLGTPYAGRSEFQLRQYYHEIAESVRSPDKTDPTKLQEAMDGIRVLYLLYICDHHLSILYGRSSIMRDNESYITGWEAYLACSLSTDADRRVAGQICLMYLMNQIRETLGAGRHKLSIASFSLDKNRRFRAGSR